jgi:hypothetical protein
LCAHRERGAALKRSSVMELVTLEETLAIVRLPAGAAVPDWVAGRDFLAVVRTRRELSIVCREEAVPPAHAEVERGFRALAVVGTLDFMLTGIVASLAAPLAEAGISIFGISTYDTDHILVRQADLEAAKRALAAAGHVVR